MSRPAQYSGMLDAVERVTGRVDYTINHELPGMLHARLLRSTTPRGFQSLLRTGIQRPAGPCD